MKSICKVSDEDLVAAIEAAHNRLLFMAPGLSLKLARAISQKWLILDPHQVNVILDVDPEVCRLGYGELDALRLMEERARHVGSLVCHQPGIRIGLLVADDTVIVFSPTPLLIEAGSTQPNHPNAIRLDGLPMNVARDVGLGENGIEDQTIGLEKVPSEKIQKVADELKTNPPVKFDIARKVLVFNAFFEFVEFELRGCFISRKTVPIQSDLIGLAKDEKAREKLRSSFKLIDENSKLSDKQITELKNRIAKDHLITLKGYGTVVLRTNKPAFEKAVKELEAKVKEFQKSVEIGLEEEIKANKQLLLDALLPSVQMNLPERWKKFIGTSPSKDQVKKMLEKDLTATFGSAKSIIKEMKVSLIFKGVTYELLNNEEFIKVASKAIPSLESLYQESIAAVSSDEAYTANVN